MRGRTVSLKWINFLERAMNGTSLLFTAPVLLTIPHAQRKENPKEILDSLVTGERHILGVISWSGRRMRRFSARASSCRLVFLRVIPTA